MDGGLNGEGHGVTRLVRKAKGDAEAEAAAPTVDSPPLMPPTHPILS